MKINLLNNIKGHWKYQKTLYNINTKTITNYKHVIKIIDLNLENKNRYKIEYKNLQYVLNINYAEDTLKIDKNNINNIYHIKSSQQEKTKIFYDSMQIQFEEIFHRINANFFLVIGIFKQYNKCIYISFTSFIKIL